VPLTAIVRPYSAGEKPCASIVSGSATMNWNRPTRNATFSSSRRRKCTSRSPTMNPRAEDSPSRGAAGLVSGIFANTSSAKSSVEAASARKSRSYPSVASDPPSAKDTAMPALRSQYIRLKASS